MNVCHLVLNYRLFSAVPLTDSVAAKTPKTLPIPEIKLITRTVATPNKKAMEHIETPKINQARSK